MNASSITEQSEHRVARWRFALVLVAFALLILAVVVQLVRLHTLDQPFLFEQGEKRTVRHEVQPGVRGLITDRHGRPLAVSTPVVNLWVNPRQVNVDELLPIAQDLSLNWSSLRSSVLRNQQQRRAFMYLQRQVEPSIAKQVLARGVTGVYGDEDFRRFYPAGEITAQTIGVVNIDGVGQEGVELAYNQHLTGQQGSRRVVKDLYGNVVRQLDVTQIAQAGGDLILTLDLRLQYLVYRELKAAVQQHKAKAGSAVLLDARNGDILALVSQPSYNPNNRAQLQPQAMRNRAIADLIEPGSTIKPFTVAAALDEGIVQASSTVDTRPGHIRVRNKTIRDIGNYGVLDMTGVVQKSSNVGVIKLAHQLGADGMWAFLAKAGVGETNVLGFPGEAIGRLPYPAQMDDLRLATVSYGYGLSMTPLQLAQAYTSFSQKGCRMPVRLVLQDYPNARCTPVMSADTAQQLLAMLETVLSNQGTGRRARVEGYRAGGKTGTSHKVGAQGYDKSAYVAMFAGLAPIDDPELILVVIVDEPQGQEYYGGEVAAPIFSRIMQQALRMRQIMPEGNAHKSPFSVPAVDREAA